MSRLVNDPDKVGPGSYEIVEELTQKSPRGAVNWSCSMTERMSSTPVTTAVSVGPGSYNIESKFYRPD